MWLWLHSWFAWRFSLTRLAMAVLFLGAFVGLNLRKIEPRQFEVGEFTLIAESCWGWPLPFVEGRDLADAFRTTTTTEFYNLPEVVTMSVGHTSESPVNQPLVILLPHELPRSHQTYRLFELNSMQWLSTGSGHIACGLVDALADAHRLTPSNRKNSTFFD